MMWLPIQTLAPNNGALIYHLEETRICRWRTSSWQTIPTNLEQSRRYDFWMPLMRDPNSTRTQETEFMLVLYRGMCTRYQWRTFQRTFRQWAARTRWSHRPSRFSWNRPGRPTRDPAMESRLRSMTPSFTLSQTCRSSYSADECVLQ